MAYTVHRNSPAIRDFGLYLIILLEATEGKQDGEKLGDAQSSSLIARGEQDMYLD
jgi:hypothetical protein